MRSDNRVKSMWTAEREISRSRTAKRCSIQSRLENWRKKKVQFSTSSFSLSNTVSKHKFSLLLRLLIIICIFFIVWKENQSHNFVATTNLYKTKIGWGINTQKRNWPPEQATKHRKKRLIQRGWQLQFHWMMMTMMMKQSHSFGRREAGAHGWIFIYIFILFLLMRLWTKVIVSRSVWVIAFLSSTIDP